MPKDLALYTATGELLATGTRLTNDELKIWLILFNKMKWQGVAIHIVQSPKRKTPNHHINKKQ